jgi:hypothetical protein
MRQLDKSMAGWIWYEDGEVIGVASDGIEVVLGWDIASALRYLMDFPCPEQW